MTKIKTVSLALLCCIAIASCSDNKNQPTMPSDSTSATPVTTPGITAADWGQTDNKKVMLYTLTNKNGMQVKISSYGGTVTSWVAADKAGGRSNIILGFDNLDGYLAKPPYFGALIGRYGNRIGDARFTLGGKTYLLAANNGKNHLHGGTKGFDKVVWDATPAADSTPLLTLHYTSKDGEEGYPGTLQVTVKYTLTDEDELKIQYDATTDKATPVNLTNHTYFNLSGDVTNTILDESLRVAADRYTPVDTTLIPTGELKAVKGTPFDFTEPHKIGERIASVAGGYDHNFILNNQSGSMKLAATLSDAVSGRKLEVYTTEPGLQFYTGNFLDGKFKNRDGKAINQHTALCLETQHWPDSPNKPSFPSTILQPGAAYHTETTYKLVLDK